MAIASVKGNQLKLDNRTSDPSSGEGTLYYNSTDKRLKLHNGTGYNDITGGAGGVQVVKKTSDYILTNDDCNGENIFTAGIAHLYGYIVGGLDNTTYRNYIQTIDTDTAVQDAVDSGDLTVARQSPGCAITEALGFAMGGEEASFSNVIDYVDFVIEAQNASDRGDLTQARASVAGVGGSLYAFCLGGRIAASAKVNVIDYIVATTTGANALDTGDLTETKGYFAGVQGNTYGFVAGGGTSAGNTPTNVIEYIFLTQTTQNGTDRGDLTSARYGVGGISGSTYGFFGGGYISGVINIIEYITLSQTSGNALDKGDLTVARQHASGTNGNTYGFFCGGFDSGYSDIIDYIDITTTSGNASDTGDLIVGMMLTGGC